MTDLGHIQCEFREAVFTDGAPPSSLTAATAPLFDIHRSNTHVLLREVLKQTFPVVHALVGEDFFAFAARRFIIDQPPQSPALLEYGGKFPEFLQNMIEAASVPYLADVARLEWALQESYHAADADPLTPDALAVVPPEFAQNLILQPHPSLKLLESSYNVRQIWLLHQDGEPSGVAMEINQPIHLAIIRASLTVDMAELDKAGFAFIQALASGARFGKAVEVGLTASPSFSAAQVFAMALGKGMFHRFTIART